jgi:hypothetical protein
MIWEQEAPLGFSAGGTVNASRLHRDDEIVWLKAASVSMSHQISGKFESFGEIYVISPNPNRSGNQWMIDTGLSRTIGHFFRFDASAGHSLHRRTGEWFVMGGVSVRGACRGCNGR